MDLRMNKFLSGILITFFISASLITLINRLNRVATDSFTSPPESTLVHLRNSRLPMTHNTANLGSAAIDSNDNQDEFTTRNTSRTLYCNAKTGIYGDDKSACSMSLWLRCELSQSLHRPWLNRQFTLHDFYEEVNRRQSHLKLVLVKNNRVFTRLLTKPTVPFVKSQQISSFFKQLAKVYRLPDVLLLVNVRTTGIDNGFPRSMVPILSNARDSSAGDVLFPNPYFLPWSREVPNLLRQSTFPWTQRYAKAVWRGQCQCPVYSSPRVTLVSMAASPLLDVAFTPQWCIPELWPEKERRQISRLRVSDKVSHRYMTRFKYIIIMPGAVGKGYTKALQYYGALGCVILLWQNGEFEFYHHSLQEGVHYLSVNASTLLPTVQALRANDSYARRLADGFHDWFRNHLTFRNVTAYAANLLEWYSGRQAFVPQKSMMNMNLQYPENVQKTECKASVRQRRSIAF